MRRRALPLLLGTAITGAVIASTAATPVLSAATPLRLLVSVTSPAAWDAIRGHGVTVVDTYPDFNVGVVEAASSASVEWVRSAPGVTAITQDRAMRTQEDSAPSSGGGVLASEALPAKAAGLTGAGVGIAVVDTGVSDTVALNRASGRLIDGTDTSGEGSFADGFGHGTAMANLVAGDAAPGTNGSPLGAAPAATVLNVKVADAAGVTSLSKVLKGMYWVHQNRGSRNIKVMLLALAAERPSAEYKPDPLTAGVDKLRESGVTVIAAVGNTAGVAGDPAFDPSVVAVGALDTTLESPAPAAFSGSATVDGYARPDVYAAGVRVLSLLPETSTLAKTYPSAKQPSGLWRGSGTSQAAALVAGLAADYIAASGNDHPDAVRAALILGSATKSGASLVTGRLPRSLKASSGENKTTWSSSSWSSSSWSSSSWSSSSWSSSSWSSSSWSSSSWSSSSWSSSSWSSSSWSSSSWSSSSWSGRGWE